MVNQNILIGIIVGVFFAGIGAGYGFFIYEFQPTEMTSRTQLLSQMMMQNPQHRMEMIDQILEEDAELQQHMIESMSQDPQQMRQWMANTQHVKEMSDVMRENHDFMMEMMQVMIEDPSMRLQMIGHMTENPEAMQQMMQMMGQDGMMMGNMSGMMGSGMQDQSMMDSGMMSGSMMANMPFNTNAPMTMPMIDGYYNGEKVFFVHTEVSDKDMANMMSMMINFPTLHVSSLKNISPDEISKVYVFTNGILGSGPYGGGPFMYQIDVFDSIPGQMEYSQFRIPHLVTWNENSTPRILTSVDEIMVAESKGELTIQKTDNVVNAPMVVWKSNGIEQRASMIQRMFESMPGVDGEVTNVDVDNYIVMLRMHSGNGMGMMDMMN
jgi:hypothetical protein